MFQESFGELKPCTRLFALFSAWILIHWCCDNNSITEIVLLNFSKEILFFLLLWFHYSVLMYVKS